MSAQEWTCGPIETSISIVDVMHSRVPNQVRVFLGSTRKDLDEDCRPGAIVAIQTGNAGLVEMASWDCEHVGAEEVCRLKVEVEASHYIGIFAYRRGWEPVFNRSITEAEYDWARDREMPMAVFVPDPAEPYSRVLKERALNQSLEHQRAQEAFLARVQERACMPFKDPSHLVAKITRRVLAWTTGGLLAADDTSASVTTKPVPKPVQVYDLARQDQGYEFEQTFEAVTDQYAGVAFVITGKPGLEHNTLARQLIERLERSDKLQTAPVSISLAALAVGPTAEGILNRLGRQLCASAVTPSSDALLAELRSRLSVGHVVVNVQDVRLLEGGLPAFVDQVWKPLLSRLDGTADGKLVFLLEYEDRLSRRDAPAVQSPCRRATLVDYDRDRLVSLTELKPFTRKEIAGCLMKRVDRVTAEKLAKGLHDVTQGQPWAVYAKLSDPSFWD